MQAFVNQLPPTYKQRVTTTSGNKQLVGLLCKHLVCHRVCVHHKHVHQITSKAASTLRQNGHRGGPTARTSARCMAHCTHMPCPQPCTPTLACPSQQIVHSATATTGLLAGLAGCINVAYSSVASSPPGLVSLPAHSRRSELDRTWSRYSVPPWSDMELAVLLPL